MTGEQQRQTDRDYHHHAILSGLSDRERNRESERQTGIERETE